MRIAITGTPGTGKSEIGKILAKKLNYEFFELEKIIKENKLYEGSMEVDPKKLSKFLKGKIGRNAVLVSHLSHLFSPELIDVVVVLRTNPKILENRLKSRGYKGKKLKENLEAEALDVCLVEALERHKKVYELETTERNPEESAEMIKKALEGKVDLSPGRVDFSYYLVK